MYFLMFPRKQHLTLHAKKIFFTENKDLTFQNLFSIGYNLHEMSNPVFLGKYFLCMKCQILFSGESKKNVTNLSTAELARKLQYVTI